MSDLFFLLVGLVLLFLGGSLLFFLVVNRTRCSKQTTGKIIAVNKKNLIWRNIHYTLHQPVYQYTVGEKKYLYEADFSSLRSGKYKVGDETVLRYNVQKPEYPSIKLHLSSLVIGTLMAAAGLTLVICYFL